MEFPAVFRLRNQPGQGRDTGSGFERLILGRACVASQERGIVEDGSAEFVEL